ncbi:MAG: hypothetical protein U9N84_13435 [Actinomycetota bacterium]|nr:hypothetical protein [Actinomycetota bacterium]
MSEMVLFVGTYNIPEGGLVAFHEQARAMTELIRDHEPQVLAVGHFLSEDQTEGTSIHLHPDADSFDFHMETASRLIGRGSQILDVTRIEFYGKPHDSIVDQLSKSFDVRVKAWADGLSRLDIE